MVAWNGWYHVNANTYGTWLPGDPRGWRERKHKKHVNGDYRNPPPAKSGDGMHNYAGGLLRQSPVRLTNVQRAIVGQAMVDLLVEQKVELLVFCLDATHLHLLGRFSITQVRPVVGRAKKHAYFELRNHKFVGRLWGNGSNVVPVKDRQHQLRVFDYITEHRDKGAWVWTFRDKWK